MRFGFEQRAIFNNAVSYTASTLNTWYLFPFFSGDGGALNTAEFALSAVNGAVTYDWGIFPVNADGTPGTQIAGGSGLVAAVGWNVIDLSSNPPSLDARKYYYLGIKLTAGTSVTFPVIDYQHLIMLVPSLSLYTWDGASLTRVANNKKWCLQFNIGSKWYGNPFTHIVLATFYAAGNSYVLPNAVPLYGAFIASAQPAEQSYEYTIRLYECNNSFIPVTLLESINVPARVGYQGLSDGQLYVEFSQVYTLQRFSIVVVQTTTAIRSREIYDGYTGNRNRVNRGYDYVKMVTSVDGSSYSVRVLSGCDTIYVMCPLFEVGIISGSSGIQYMSPHLTIT